MKQKISIAARKNTPKNLSRSHYTTLNFGHIYPIYVEEFCNGSKVSLKVDSFARVAPQFLPNLGRIDMKLHAFFVPFHLVWNHYENFVEGLPSWNNQGSQVYKYAPTFNDCDLTYWFTTVSRGLAREVPSQEIQSQGFDFVTCYNSIGDTRYYRFTPKGKYVYHVLNSLGYNFAFVPYNGDEVNYELVEPMSALPLLSFFKLYLDYFIPSQLQPSSILHSIFAFLHDLTAENLADWYFMRSTGDSTKQSFTSRIFDYFDEMYYYYQNNYFTSAWMHPNAPVPGLNNIGQSSTDRPVINSISSQLSSSDNSVINQSIANTDNGVQRVQFPSPTVSSVSVSPSQSQLTADGLTFMQKFARLVKRSNFVGSRAIERILGKFGIRITDFESNLSTYLGSDSIVMSQSDVTVTGSLEESGDYTGKSWFSSGSNVRVFKCNADLYGLMFVTASLQTPSTPLDGVRRRNKHIQPLDFYNPDLDGALMQAISGSEVFKRNPFISNVNTETFTGIRLDPSSTFGYQLRFMEFKTALDDISGDFLVPSLNKNIDNFILPRRLFDMHAIHDDIITGTEDPDWNSHAYSAETRKGLPVTPISLLKGDDMNQFNRIFRQTDGSADPIFNVFRFNVVVNNCVLPADTSAELDGRGKEIEFETNGVHV